jgi:hydrogenase nickel incorporation protein HypA/HybF
MHELSFATEILEHVERQARQHGAVRVTRIKLRLGPLSGINEDSLSFCLEAIARDTLAAGAGIAFTAGGLDAVCAACGRSPVSDTAPALCPRCGGPAELSLGTEVCIEEIELDVPENQA